MNWSEVTFGEIVRTAQNGFGGRRGEGRPSVVLRLADVDSDAWRVSGSDLRHVGMSDAERAKYGLAHGDLLVVRVNGSPRIAGRVVRYAGPENFAYCDHFIRFQVSDQVDPTFVAYQFRHRPVREQVERGMVSTAGQHTVSQRTLMGVRLYLPYRPEQQRIVAEIETQFSRLDAAVASLQRVKANLKRARASVLKAAVEGRLVPTEAALAKAEGRTYEPADKLLERILVERKRRWTESGAKGKYKEPVKPDLTDAVAAPEGWAWCPVDAFATFVTSGSRGWAEYYSDSGPLFVRIGNLRRGQIEIDFAEVQHVQPPTRSEGERTRLQDGDVLISITADLGIVGLFRGARAGEAYINQHIALVRPVMGATASYLAWFAASEGGQRQFSNQKRGATKVGLGLDDIRGTLVCVPPLAEQHRIVAEVERRLSVLDAIEATTDANLTRCERLRQSVLKLAFEGRLVPQESTVPNDKEPT